MALIRIEDYKPQGMLVMIDPTEDKIRKHFRCPVCGCIVFDYYGGIKLIMNAFYDENPAENGTLGVESPFVAGKEVDWFKTLGVPYPIECPGQLKLAFANGERKRTRCKTMLYKIGA